MEKLIVILFILLAIYGLVFLAIMADLWSGLRKAKSRGVMRTSYGFRRTVDKANRYYNLLLCLTIMDAMHIVAIWYIETYYDRTFIMFPFVTLIGAICYCVIEVKSIYEKAEDKARFDEVGRLAGTILSKKEDIKEIAIAIGEYMEANKKNEHENTDTITNDIHAN